MDTHKTAGRRRAILIAADDEYGARYIAEVRSDGALGQLRAGDPHALRIHLRRVPLRRLHSSTLDFFAMLGDVLVTPAARGLAGSAPMPFSRTVANMSPQPSRNSCLISADVSWMTRDNVCSGVVQRELLRHKPAQRVAVNMRRADSQSREQL